MVHNDDYTSHTKWDVCDTSTSITIHNPYDHHLDELINSLKELSKALNKLKYDENSRMYSSIRDKTKLTPIVVQKQPNYSIRNKLICKRTIKQGINFKNN
jgi:hypothetical protein